MREANVIPLFVSDDDLDGAWQAFDAAMLHMNGLYADPDSTEEARRAAATAALEAETHFRAMFARTAPRRAGA